MTWGQNYRNWPDRSLAWSDDLQRKIELFFDGEAAPTCTLSIVAWQDRPDGRYWKQEIVAKAVPIFGVQGRLFELLDRARVTADSWTAGDLRHIAP
jgi:hypothetical protein